MAQFVVRHAAADWSPPGGVEINIEVGDSLETELPRADVVVINPPFIAWSALDSRQRDQMRQVLGSRLQGRGDLSMAFISRALDLVKQGGAIGVLFPASLLTLQAAEGWRNDLLERSDLCLLASLGEYGLFAYALIQVAAAVLAKPSNQGPRRRTTTALVTSNNAAATGNALRTLRRSGRGERGFGEDDAWRLFEIPIAGIKRRPTWRLTSPRTEAALSRLITSGASRISDLFQVRQGVRTGDNRTFLLDERKFASLPAQERAFFKPAVMNESDSRWVS